MSGITGFVVIEQGGSILQSGLSERNDTSSGDFGLCTGDAFEGYVESVRDAGGEVVTNGIDAGANDDDEAFRGVGDDNSTSTGSCFTVCDSYILGGDNKYDQP